MWHFLTMTHQEISRPLGELLTEMEAWSKFCLLARWKCNSGLHTGFFFVGGGGGFFNFRETMWLIDHSEGAEEVCVAPPMLRAAQKLKLIITLFDCEVSIVDQLGQCYYVFHWDSYLPPTLCMKPCPIEVVHLLVIKMDVSLLHDVYMCHEIKSPLPKLITVWVLGQHSQQGWSQSEHCNRLCACWQVAKSAKMAFYEGRSLRWPHLLAIAKKQGCSLASLPLCIRGVGSRGARGAVAPLGLWMWRLSETSFYGVAVVSQPPPPPSKEHLPTPLCISQCGR